jgi:cobalt-zinc-cadmium resistance protein CzcA
MKEKLEVIAGASFEFTQPIQLRFNELLTGAKTDIAVKIFGENTTVLKQQADRAADIIKGIPGAGDVKVEQTEGLPQLMVEFNRPKIAEYGLDIEQLNTLVRTAFAGETAGVVFENERKFDLVVRLDQPSRQELDLQQLFVHLPDGRSLPMSEVAKVHYTEGPMQISREGTRRRINIGVNVRDRDVASLVADIESQLKSGLDLPAGYYIKYGGQFENLEAAKARLGVAVPAALALIFVLLYFTFGKLKYALMIFTAVPTAAVGGILGLWARGMPFSISAGVGFIALFGVAVLNGIVLISHFNRLRYEEGYTDIRKVVIDGGLARMRPVVMTATVAALGFLPMALSTSNGAEVQKPLATVVIGGLITATLLTLLVLPVLYYLANKNLKPSAPGAAMIALLLLATPAMAQQPLTLDYATQQALELNPDLQNGTLSIQQAQLGITAAREIPQTEFMAGFGQYNTTMGDYQVSITQPLSPFGLNKKQEAAARAQLALSGSQQALLEHQVTFGIRQAQQNWLAEQARLQLYQRQELVFQNLADRAALQLRAGAIDRLSYTLAQQQLTQAQSATRQARQQEEQAFRRFQQLAYSPASVRPADSLQALISGTADTTAALQAFLRPLEQEMQAATANAEVEAQRLQPQLSFGYMQQSIRPDIPLNAVQIGLRAPVFQKSQRARIAQAELEATKAAQQLQGQRQQLEQERQMAQVQWQQLARQLEEQGPALLAQARQLRQLAQLQLEQGEVNYFQYAQSLNAALSSELERINLTARYNQAMLYLEFLSQ